MDSLFVKSVKNVHKMVDITSMVFHFDQKKMEQKLFVIFSSVKSINFIFLQKGASKKGPNFIRTKGRHFDNLMTWLVRLGSIK